MKIFSSLSALISPKNIIVLFGLSLVASAVSVTSYFYPLLMRRLIEQVEFQRFLDFQLLSVYLSLLLLGVALQYGGTVAFQRKRLNLIYDLKQKLLISISDLNTNEVKANGTGFYVTKINQEIANAFSIINIQFAKGSITVGRMVAVLTLTFIWDPIVTMIFLANIVMYSLCAFAIKRFTSPVVAEIAKTVPDYNSFLITFIKGVRTYATNGRLRDRFSEHWKRCKELNRLEFRQFLRGETASVVLVDVTHLVSFIVLLWHSVNQYLRGTYSLGQIYATLEYFKFIVDPIDIFVNISRILVFSQEFINRLLDQLKRTSETQGVFHDDSIDERAQSIIRYDDVTILDAVGNSLLKNLNFELQRGEKVGFVGASGAGKSLFYGPLFERDLVVEGDIEFFGKNIKKFSRQFLLKSIGYYSDEVFVERGSLEKNLFLGDEKKEKISALLSELNLAHLYDRMINEDGGNISFGEKTRVVSP